MKKVVIIVTFVFSLFILFLLYRGKQSVQPPQNISINPNSNENPPNNMVSGSQDLEIQIPSKATVITSASSTQVAIDEGTIVIIRNGTNYDNLADYLIDLDSHNVKDIKSEEPLIINGHNFVSRNLGGTKQYYGYVDGWIYNFSTSSPELYDDLDQIAQSFKYLGD